MNSVFVRQEGGFTTPAAAVALLVVCGLLFVTMRGFIIGTRAGEIQYVADAGALAADNAVAEFVTAGQVVDAALLSFSLVGITVYAASAVASFIPGGAAAAAELASAGSKVLQLRDKFAETAVKGLNAAQEALPVICAVRSAQVIAANADASGVDYVGIALASPLHADPVELPDNTEVNEAAQDIESREAKIQEKSEQQKRAQEQQDAAKQRAFEADCGSSTCLRERASHLAGLPDAQNPSYSSIKTWTFAAPLARAKAYYALRLQNEPGSAAGGSPERVAESVARKQFYEYAQKEVSGGSIERTERGVELPNMKPLARNAEQIRSTYLYTQRIYPVSQNGDKRVLHAYAGCPAYQSGTPSGTASVQEIDGGGVQRCETCRFSAVTLGRVPAASTSIDNGFEYYYKAVVDASQEYRAAALESEQIRRELEEEAEGIRGDLKKAVAAMGGKRYDPQPPGRYGCVCVVFAPESALSTPFVSGSEGAPARVALSGATLAPDSADDEGSVISDIATGLMPEESIGSGLLHAVLGAWSDALRAYTGGTEAVEDLFDNQVRKIPLVGNDLSSWASGKFKDALTMTSLEPPDLQSYKPVLVNTSHILERDGGSAAAALLRAKQAAGYFSVGDMKGLVGMFAEELELPELGDVLTDEGLVVARVPLQELGLGTQDGKLTLPVPVDLQAQYASVLGALQTKAG